MADATKHILAKLDLHNQQVKRFALLPRPFSMEQGELTNTLKLRRAVVAEHFKEVIDKMYAEAEAEQQAQKEGN